MICVDTDVLAIHHIFTWDKRYDLNEEVFNKLREEGKLCTTIHNVLELCGLFSVAGLSKRVSKALEKYLGSKDVVVLFPDEFGDWGEYVSLVFQYIKRGMSYGDSLVALTIEQHDEIELFLTWNVKHFRGKIGLEVLTPKEYLAGRSQI